VQVIISYANLKNYIQPVQTLKLNEIVESNSLLTMIKSYGLKEIMVIIKSHSVQINMIPGRSWFRRKPFRGSSLKQELPQKGFSLWTKYSKSIKIHIWYIVFSSPRVSKSITIWKKTLPWELFVMFEKNTNQELPQKGFSPWTKCSKTIQTLIFGRATLIIKSHSVQINTDPRKTWNKTLSW